jgi:ATP-dependent DNA helicase RecQ
VVHLINVLMGKEDERIRALGHHTLSTFNIGAEHTLNEWRAIYRQLVAMNLLASAGEHGGLKITHEGMAFLKERPPLPLRKLAVRARKKDRVRRHAPVAEFEGDEAPALFEQLRSLRMQLAREQNLPPYVIFHDKTLRELATRRPATMEDLAEISGVGESKSKRYGAIFLEAIAAYAAA